MTIEEYYDKRSSSYDSTFDMLYFKLFDVITWKYIEPYVPVDPDALVLDAGGGTGRWTIRMAQKGCKVILMDVSEKMLRIAAEKVKEEGLQGKITTEKADITKTGYADEMFDMILCEHTLFLFKEPDILIRELKRVLKRKARLIISAHNRYVQSLASLPEKSSPDKVNHALKILLRKKYNTMTKRGKVKFIHGLQTSFEQCWKEMDFKWKRSLPKALLCLCGSQRNCL